MIGLSLAYELAGHGLRVKVIDAGAPGKEASWAGAGILPPAPSASDSPIEQLLAISNRLHGEWSTEFRERFGIDNGYRRSGGIYLARDEHAAASLQETIALWRAGKIAVEELTPQRLNQLEPNLQPASPIVVAAYLPDEHQVRNPRHLKALLAACAERGVEVLSGVAAEDFDLQGGRIRAVRTTAGKMAAECVTITSGSWSQTLAARLGCSPAIKPIRGQIALLASNKPLLTAVINEGKRYLVPRTDGRVLVGSTEEDAGYDRSTTPEGIGGVMEFAISLAPALAGVQFERSWAGLRPGTVDGLPYLGRLPGVDNAFIAAGHFRCGLQLSPGTARVMCQLIRGESPLVDLRPFRVER